MSKGENIFKRKDGRWEARYIKNRLPSGKIKYGYCYGKTYREAKEKVVKCKATVALGISEPCQSGNQPFSHYCDAWLTSRKSRIAESSYVKYHQVLDLHIKPQLGHCQLKEITNQTIDEFSHYLIFSEGLAPKTAKDILVVLRSILKSTETHLPASHIPLEVVYPKIQKTEMRILSSKEQTVIMSYLMDNVDSCKYGILLAMVTGIRIGELCAMTWGNVSLPDLTIKVSATMQRLKELDTTKSAKTKVIISAPKSNTSFRVIPIPDFLEELSRKMYVADPSAFILTGCRKMMEPRTLQYRFEKCMAECDVADVHFHTLRHTFATRCVESGFEIKSLSEVLGHASTTITLDRYVHSSLSLKRENMNKVVSSLL